MAKTARADLLKVYSGGTAPIIVPPVATRTPRPRKENSPRQRAQKVEKTPSPAPRKPDPAKQVEAARLRVQSLRASGYRPKQIEDILRKEGATPQILNQVL